MPNVSTNGNFQREFPTERLPGMHPHALALRHAAMRGFVSPKPNPRTPRFTQFRPLSETLRSFTEIFSEWLKLSIQ